MTNTIELVQDAPTTLLDWKPLFKAKAHAKTATREDMVTFAILKTIFAKGENKQEILNHIVARMFTPGKVCEHRFHPYQAVREAGNIVYNRATNSYFNKTSLFGEVNIDTVLNVEQHNLFKELAHSLRSYEGIS